MATKKTSGIGVAGEPQATGFILTGGTTTQKALTVTADATIDQNVSSTSAPTFTGITIDADIITDIDVAVDGLVDSDAHIPSSATVIDAIGTASETISIVTADVTPAVVGNTYIANKAGTSCVITLPAAAATTKKIGVIGMGATGWTITAAALDTIQVQNLITVGGGSVTNIGQFDSLELVCEVADSGWVARNMSGSFNVQIS